MRIVKTDKKDSQRINCRKMRYRRVAAIILAVALFCCPIRSIHAEEEKKDEENEQD